MTKPERHFTLDFPNSVPLNYKYYTDDKYNDVRRCKIILFSHCLGENDVFKNTYNNELEKKKCITDAFFRNINLTEKTINKINGYAYTVYLDKEFISKYLERGCYNRTIEKANSYNIRCIWSNPDFVNLYHSICYKVASNLDTESIVESEYIREKIINREVEPITVANMTSKELCPKKYKKIDEKLSKRTNLERKIKYSELYRCRKCKTNKTTTERRYNRSLDEGVNLTIHCVNCGFSWNG